MQRHLFGRKAMLVLFAAALPAFAADPKSDDWPQFRGPHRNDVSDDKGLLKKWPAAGPSLVWKCPGVGIGFSSLAVAGNQIFTMGDLADGCYLFALIAAKAFFNGRSKSARMEETTKGRAALPMSMAIPFMASGSSAISSVSTSRTARCAGERT